MKVILNKINQAVKQLGNQLGNRRCSSANGLFTSEIVGAVTSLILLRKNVGRRSPVTITSLISMLSLGLISLAMPIMFSSSVSATQSTITMSVASSIAIDVLPTTNGNFVSSSTSDTIVSVMTDNYTGYHLGIAASAANSTALSYTDNNSVVHTIPSISSSVSATNYADDTFATSNNLNNTWGFRPSKYNSTDNTDYLPIPSDTTPTALDTTNEPNASTANTYNIAIGARVDLNQAPGSYTNTFIITAIANAVPYTITYNANTGSASTDSTVTNMPANVTNGTTYADTVNLSSTTPTRTGYDFTGWCIGTSTSSNVTTTAGVDSCSSTTISAGGDITLDQTSSSNDFYLYAIWSLTSYNVTVNFTGTGISSVTFTNSTYGDATTVTASGNTTTLKHGVPYTITATISSGNEFVGWTTATNGTLSSTTTNPTTYTVTGSSTLTVEGKSNKTYIQDFTTAQCSTLASSANYTVYDKRDEQDYTVRYINGACWMTQNLRFTGTSLTTTDSNVTSNKTLTWRDLATNSGCKSTSTTGNGMKFTCMKTSDDTSYGAWYNYSGATAGTITGSSNTTDASESICPKNWTLPANGTSAGQIGSVTSYKDAFSPVYGGYYYGGSLYSASTGGYWWSATAYLTANRYHLTYSSGSLRTDSGSRCNGLYVRCVRTSS